MSDSNTAPEEFAERMNDPLVKMAADRSNYTENGDEQAVMVAYSQILTELEEVLPGIDMEVFRRMLSTAPETIDVTATFLTLVSSGLSVEEATCVCVALEPSFEHPVTRTSSDYLDDLTTLPDTLRAFVKFYGNPVELCAYGDVFDFMSSLTDGALMALGEKEDVTMAADIALAGMDAGSRQLVVDGLHGMFAAAQTMTGELFCRCSGVRLELNDLGDLEARGPGDEAL